VLVAGSVFLPWASSGRATRSGLELAPLADRLGLADTALRRALVVAVAFLPGLAGAVWVAAGLRRPAWVATLGVVTAVALTGGSDRVAGPLEADVGPWIATAAACITLTGAAQLARGGRKGERREPEVGA